MTTFTKGQRVRCNASTMPQPHGWEGETGTVLQALYQAGFVLVRMDRQHEGQDRDLPFREHEIDAVEEKPWDIALQDGAAL